MAHLNKQLAGTPHSTVDRVAPPNSTHNVKCQNAYADTMTISLMLMSGGQIRSTGRTFNIKLTQYFLF